VRARRQAILGRMTRFTRTLVVLAAALAATAFAQPLSNVGFVDSQYLLTIHPAYQQIVETREMATAELNQVAATVQDLQGRQQAGQTLTAEEQERLQVSIQTLQARYDQEIQALAQPAIDAVNAAIARVAAEMSIGVVLDANVAREMGLVVYAAPGNDLTPMVEAALREGL